jgi:hypothetical protein
MTPPTRKSFFKYAIVVVLLIAATASVSKHWWRHAYLVVTPARYSECVGANIVAHVHWDMRGSAIGPYVYVSAYRVGMLPTTFSSGSLVGDAVTGEWVSDGTTIMLTDEKGRVLGKRTIESVDCPTTPIWASSP